MQNRKQSLLKRLLSMLVGTAMMATMITVLIPLPVANAVAATSVVVSAKFNNAGLAACADNIFVTFTEPVCGDADCTEGLSVSNFVFTPDNGTGMQSISSVSHTAGNDWALLTMNAVSEAGDTASTLRVEEVFTPSGMIKEDSALTVALTTDTTAPTVSVKRFKEGADDLLLQFSEPVQEKACANSVLAAADFTYADAGADTMTAITTATSTAHRDWVFLKGDANHAAATDGAETLAPVDNEVYDMVGNEWTEAATAISTFTSDVAIPTITAAYGRIGEDTTGGNDLVYVSFSEPVFAANTGSGNLVAADFAHSTATVSTATHTAGDTFAVLDLNANQTAMGTIDSEAADDDVFDVFGTALTGATAAVTITDNTFPTLRGVWVNQFIDHANTAPTALGGGTVTAVRVTSEAALAYPQEGAKMMRWTDGAVVAGTDGFAGPDLNVDLYDTTNDLYEFTQVKFDLYYEDNSANTALTDDTDLLFILNDAADFTTASEWYITTDLTEKGWTTVTVDLTGAVSSGTALASQVGNPQFYGIKTDASLTNFANDDVIYMDNVRFSRGASSKSNQIYLEYSEAVNVAGDPAVGASGASATTAGDMTTSKTLAGMGAFATGALTTKTLTNTVAKSADGSMYTVTLANRSGGTVTTASPTTLTGLFTPTVNVTDIATNAIEAASTHTPETIIDALDLTTAATAPTDFVPTLVTGGQVRLGWSSPSQTAATFSHYAVTYGTSAGVTVASTLWDESNDATLSTATTNTTTVTSLTDGTVYYFNIAAVDVKGLGTTLVTEKSALPSAASGSKVETVAPAIPSNIKATVNSAGKVVLTWSDPSDTDLSYMNLAKSIGKDVAPASVLTTLNPGIKTYTDSAVAIGDVVNYKMNAVDKNGNSSAYSAVVSVTVKLPDAAAPATEPATGDAAAAADEAAAETGEEGATEEGAEDIDVEEGDVESSMDEDTAEDEGEDEVSTEVKLTDISTHWAKKEVEAMVEAGVIKGYKDGSFKPNNNLNRAESGILLCRVLGIDESEPADSDPFTDVKKDIWYGGCVAELKASMIVKGNPDKTYKPMSNINRAEFVTLVMRAYSDMLDEEEKADLDAMLNASEPKASFSDVNVKTDWYANVAYSAMNKGFVKGNPCGADKKSMCFNGGTSITRAEATTVLYRVFGDLL